MNILGNIAMKLENTTQYFTMLNSRQKIYIATLDKVLYPDVLVVFETPEHFEDSESLLINPLLIVEVASKTTRQYDRGEKFMLYRSLPSFREYVLIEQDSTKVEVWFRSAENKWEINCETRLENSIFLQSICLNISLLDIYENIMDL